jgi:hypothetical protein
LCSQLRFPFEKLTNIYYKDASFYPVEKSMRDQYFCQSCCQKDRCEDVFRRLGEAQGPSVASGAALAFLLPIVVFIVALAVFERVLTGVMKTGGLRTALGLLLALSVTAVCVFAIKAAGKRPGKDE